MFRHFIFLGHVWFHTGLNSFITRKSSDFSEWLGDPRKGTCKGIKIHTNSCRGRPGSPSEFCFFGAHSFGNWPSFMFDDFVEISLHGSLMLEQKASCSFVVFFVVVVVVLLLAKTISWTKFNVSGKLPNHFVAGDGPYYKGFFNFWSSPRAC